MQRLLDSEEQFAKVSGGLLLRLERPGDAGQPLLGDRVKDGSDAAFEKEMDRGRADPQRLGELAKAEPVCADALSRARRDFDVDGMDNVAEGRDEPSSRLSSASARIAWLAGMLLKMRCGLSAAVRVGALAKCGHMARRVRPPTEECGHTSLFRCMVALWPAVQSLAPGPTANGLFSALGRDP